MRAPTQAKKVQKKKKMKGYEADEGCALSVIFKHQYRGRGFLLRHLPCVMALLREFQLMPKNDVAKSIFASRDF